MKVDDETLVPTTSGPVMVMLPGPKLTGPSWVVDSADPLQITLVTRAALQTGQAHVVRVQQVHDGTTLVGGYTTVLLPT